MKDKKPMKFIQDAPKEEFDEMMREITNGASYYAMEKKYGYHRESIKRAWVRFEDSKRIKIMAEEAKKRNTDIHSALQEIKPDAGVSVVDQKTAIAFEMAMDELIIRFSGNNAKSLSDRDLISACKLLYEIRRGNMEPSDGLPARNQYTQNVVNVFARAIQETIDIQDYAKES